MDGQKPTFNNAAANNAAAGLDDDYRESQGDSSTAQKGHDDDGPDARRLASQQRAMAANHRNLFTQNGLFVIPPPSPVINSVAGSPPSRE